jgi:protein gp37
MGDRSAIEWTDATWNRLRPRNALGFDNALVCMKSANRRMAAAGFVQHRNPIYDH